MNTGQSFPKKEFFDLFGYGQTGMVMILNIFLESQTGHWQLSTVKPQPPRIGGRSGTPAGPRGYRQLRPFACAPSLVQKASGPPTPQRVHPVKFCFADILPGRMISKGKKVKKQKLLCPGKAEAQVDVPETWGVPVAIR